MKFKADPVIAGYVWIYREAMCAGLYRGQYILATLFISASRANAQSNRLLKNPVLFLNSGRWIIYIIWIRFCNWQWTCSKTINLKPSKGHRHGQAAEIKDDALRLHQTPVKHSRNPPPLVIRQCTMNNPNLLVMEMVKAVIQESAGWKVMCLKISVWEWWEQQSCVFTFWLPCSW